jgi:type II secretory pathway pseudopilin PulG
MKFIRLLKGEEGITLIEMAVAIAITGIIGLGAAVAVYHVMTQSDQNTGATSARHNVLNAIHWMSRDVQMAQTVSPEGVSGFPLTLRWVAWDNVTHEVVYSIEDGELTRWYSDDSGEESESVVAQYINPDAEMTNCEFSGGVLTLRITATVGEGLNAVSVGKVREVAPRPGL